MLRGRSGQALVRGLAAVLLFLACTGRVPISAYAADPPAGSDVCPESNDSYEGACFLGPDAEVFGFLSSSRDVDMYRVEPLDFGVRLHVELAESPFPYGLTIVNWNGGVVAQSPDGGAPALDVTLGPPGSYYVAVSHFRDNEFNPTTPYRLVTKQAYVGSMPNVIYSATFRAGGGEAEDYSSDDSDATYEINHGHMTIKMKRGGTRSNPAEAGDWLPIDESPSDFTLTLDARLVSKTDSGYAIQFRSPDDADADTGYRVAIDPGERNVKLTLSDVENNVHKDLTKWLPSNAITSDGANRIVVRCHGSDIIININGTEVIHAKDDTLKDGMIWFAALDWSREPAIVNYGNILVTVP